MGHNPDGSVLCTEEEHHLIPGAHMKMLQNATAGKLCKENPCCIYKTSTGCWEAGDSLIDNWDYRGTAINRKHQQGGFS